MKLNLGCGSRPFEGWVNVDVVRLEGVDVVIDLESAEWPWAENSIDEIRAYDVIEHLREPYDFLMNCHRVLKPGGILDLRFPHRAHNDAYHITHRNRFDEDSFDSVTKNHVFDEVEVRTFHAWPFYWHVRRYLGEDFTRLPFFKPRAVEIKLRKN